MSLDDPKYFAEIRKYRFVASPGSRLVCVGEINGSYNYQYIGDVYPADKPFIPVENRFGSIDYLPNPNYKQKKC